MKDNSEVIAEFNDYVNMTAAELEKWLKSDDSNSAGWPKAGHENDESIGHNSGRQIVEILKSNPGKDADKYTDDQLQHMRKVAAYCKRHLAQEAARNKEKDPEEVKETKSYVSLKNWGHDFLRAQGKESGSANGRAAKASSKSKQGASEDKDVEEQGGKDNESDADFDADEGMSGDDDDSNDKDGRKESQDAEQDDDDDDEEKTPAKQNGKIDMGNDDCTRADDENEDDKRAGDKRKKTSKQSDPKKKRDTGKTRTFTRKANQDEDTHSNEESEDQAGDPGTEEEVEGDGDSGQASSKKGPQKGQTVSWKWGNGNPEGKVLDVKEEKYALALVQMLRISIAFQHVLTL